MDLINQMTSIRERNRTYDTDDMRARLYKRADKYIYIYLKLNIIISSQALLPL